MTYLALRNLGQQRLRFGLSVSGVALAIMLIVLLNGFLAGIFRQVTAYLDQTSPDFVVAEEGVTNLLGARSMLPNGVAARARGVAGVAAVTPIITQFVILDLHDKKVVGYLVGYDAEQGGGPWQITGGRQVDGEDEVVLDAVMAQTHRIMLGDRLEILDEEFTVVGFSQGTNSWMASFLFVDTRAAARVLRRPNTLSYLLLTQVPGSDREVLEARLRRRLRNTQILPAATLKQNDINLLVRIFAGPLYLMVTIAYAVGTAILGMLIFTSTAERLREFGVLKAIGAQNHHLYGLVILQGMVLALLGTGLGSGLAWVASQIIMAHMPKFLIVVEPQTMLVTTLSGLLMGMLAAAVPVYWVGQLDPAQVFRK